MAFDDSGRHPQWPKVADAVIEAGNSKALFAPAPRERRMRHTPAGIPRLWCAHAPRVGLPGRMG